MCVKRICLTPEESDSLIEALHEYNHILNKRYEKQIDLLSNLSFSEGLAAESAKLAANNAADRILKEIDLNLEVIEIVQNTGFFDEDD